MRKLRVDGILDMAVIHMVHCCTKQGSIQHSIPFYKCRGSVALKAAVKRFKNAYPGCKTCTFSRPETEDERLSSLTANRIGVPWRMIIDMEV